VVNRETPSEGDDGSRKIFERGLDYVEIALRGGARLLAHEKHFLVERVPDER
jgi:hypothetical protein